MISDDFYTEEKDYQLRLRQTRIRGFRAYVGKKYPETFKITVLQELPDCEKRVAGESIGFCRLEDFATGDLVGRVYFSDKFGAMLQPGRHPTRAGNDLCDLDSLCKAFDKMFQTLKPQFSRFNDFGKWVYDVQDIISPVYGYTVVPHWEEYKRRLHPMMESWLKYKPKKVLKYAAEFDEYLGDLQKQGYPQLIQHRLEQKIKA